MCSLVVECVLLLWNVFSFSLAEPGLPPRLPAAGPANRSAAPDMFTAPTERENLAVSRVAQVQAAASRGKRPTGYFSLNTAHPGGCALPSRHAQRLNEPASMAHWEAMEELQRQFPQQSGNVRNFYTALALVRPHVMEAYATGTNSAGVQRHQTPQVLDPMRTYPNKTYFERTHSKKPHSERTYSERAHSERTDSERTHAGVGPDNDGICQGHRPAQHWPGNTICQRRVLWDPPHDRVVSRGACDGGSERECAHPRR